MFITAILIAAGFGIAAIVGAPWLPTRQRQAECALELLALKPGDTVLDLGSGSGSFLLLAARRGIKGVGYEINPLLWLWSLVRTWPYRHLVSIHFGNYWTVKLPPTDGIYVFLIDHYMQKLDNKLSMELIRPTKVASYIFQIPGQEPVEEKDGVFLYEYK